jgi:hypothetical protein
MFGCTKGDRGKTSSWNEKWATRDGFDVSISYYYIHCLAETARSGLNIEN